MGCVTDSQVNTLPSDEVKMEKVGSFRGAGVYLVMFMVKIEDGKV